MIPSLDLSGLSSAKRPVMSYGSPRPGTAPTSSAARYSVTPRKETGLVNKPGDNNCFLNVILQALFHIDSFGDGLLEHADKDHDCVSGCMLCGIASLFEAQQQTEGDSIEVWTLRQTLADTSKNGINFDVGGMSDAAEALEALLEKLHSISYPNRSETCEPDDCWLHRTLGTLLTSSRTCDTCDFVPKELSYWSHITYLPASAIYREGYSIKRNHLFKAFLNCGADNVTYGTCDAPDCKGKVTITETASHLPDVLVVNLMWKTRYAETREIEGTAYQLQEKVAVSDLPIFSNVPVEYKWVELLGFICYYKGSHYVAYFKDQKGVWIYLDDSTVRPLDSDLLSAQMHMVRSQYQPCLLFYKTAAFPPAVVTSPRVAVSSTRTNPNHGEESVTGYLRETEIEKKSKKSAPISTPVSPVMAEYQKNDFQSVYNNNTNIATAGNSTIAPTSVLSTDYLASRTAVKTKVRDEQPSVRIRETGATSQSSYSSLLSDSSKFNVSGKHREPVKSATSSSSAREPLKDNTQFRSSAKPLSSFDKYSTVDKFTPTDKYSTVDKFTPTDKYSIGNKYPTDTSNKYASGLYSTAREVTSPREYQQTPLSSSSTRVDRHSEIADIEWQMIQAAVRREEAKSRKEKQQQEQQEQQRRQRQQEQQRQQQQEQRQREFRSEQLRNEDLRRYDEKSRDDARARERLQRSPFSNDPYLSSLRHSTTPVQRQRASSSGVSSGRSAYNPSTYTAASYGAPLRADYRYPAYTSSGSFGSTSYPLSRTNIQTPRYS